MPDDSGPPTGKDPAAPTNVLGRWPFWALVVAVVIALLLVFVAFSLFAPESEVPDEEPVTQSQPSDEPAAEQDTGTESQPSDDPAPEQETVEEDAPAGNSGQASDPAGDNGRDGVGADILGLEYLQGEDLFTVLLLMGFSPLESSILWYSYYLEVTFVFFNDAVRVLIWETHAGESRNGELDSDGTANGEGVELTHKGARFTVKANPGDGDVKEIRVNAFSVVEKGDPVTKDEMHEPVASP